MFSFEISAQFEWLVSHWLNFSKCLKQSLQTNKNLLDFNSLAVQQESCYLNTLYVAALRIENILTKT